MLQLRWLQMSSFLSGINGLEPVIFNGFSAEFKLTAILSLTTIIWPLNSSAIMPLRHSID